MIIIAVIVALASLVLGLTGDERFLWVLAGPALIAIKGGSLFWLLLGRSVGKATDPQFLDGRSELARRREHQWPERSGDAPESGASE